MRCAEAAEFVSAMADGEAVPLHAAQHVAGCARCRALLLSYAEMGAEVRSLGSLALTEPVRARTWVQPKPSWTTWWEKGWTMMRVPRVAFASLVLLLGVVASRLAVVEVRAHEDGSVLLLKMTPAKGDAVQCSVPLAHTDPDHCGGLAQISKSNLFFNVQAIRKEGDRVLLSIRAKVDPLGPASYGPETAATLPETQAWFTPGQTLAVPNTGELQLQLTGQWTDHVPVAVGDNTSLDPGANEIRLADPLVLKNNKVIGDTLGRSDANAAGDGTYLYIPGEGRFVMASEPFTGAVQAEVKLNRITFQSDGQKYVIVTGMPVTRSTTLWVLHQPDYKPAGNENTVWIGAGELKRML